MMKPYLLLLCSLLSLGVEAWADGAGKISELPSSIKPPESGVALIADFDHPAGGGIPVYLINRSGKGFTLPPDGGGLKLEYQDSAGKWTRAEPHAYPHRYDVSFDFPTLPDGYFVAVTGYQPAKGETATIRFRFYELPMEIASNVGKGLISPEDVEKARNDEMAVRKGDFAMLADVARGKVVLHNTMDHRTDLRELAIDTLARGDFDRHKVEAVLREIVAAKEVTYSKTAQEGLHVIKSRAEQAK